MMIQRCLVVLVLALPMAAQEALIPWIGPTERVIPNHGIVSIPLTLAADVKDAPQVRQVTYLGEELGSKSVTAKWNGAALNRDLVLTVDTKETKRIGTYTVAIQIATPDAAKFPAKSLEVKLTSRGPAISVPMPLRAERVTYLPFFWDRWYPEAWPMNETSLRDPFTPTTKRWAVTLKMAETAPAGSLLYIDLVPPIAPEEGDTKALTLAAGGQALLKPTSGSSCCPFGTVSGKFSINEVPLAAPIEVPVEVLSRLSRFWLFAILVVSIVLGHYTRKVLEEKRALATASAAAAAVRKDLSALSITVAGDEAFTRSVKDERTKLYDAVKREEPGDITSAAKSAAEAVAKIRADHAKARKEATDLVKTLRDAVGDPAAQSRQLHTTAEKIDQQLDALEARLATGRVTGMLDEVQALEQDAIKTTAHALIGWQEHMSVLLAEMKNWADIDTTVLTQMRTKVDAMTSDDLEHVKTVFATATTADTHLNVQMASFLDEVDRLVELVKQEIGGTALQPLPEDLATTAATRPDLAAKQLRDTRRALQEELRKAVPKKETEPPAIGESKFEEAVRAVKAFKGEEDEEMLLGDAHDPVAIAASAIAVRRAAGAAPPVSTLSGTIEVSDDPIVGEPLQLTFHVTDNGVPVPHIDVTWWNGDSYITAGTTLVYTPPSPTPVVLRARTTVGKSPIERTERIAAAPSSLFDPDQLRDTIYGVTWIQTVVAGFFITLIGYSMFAKSFIGTLADLAAAALWGFGTDITLAKLAELAQPAVQRTLNPAAAAPAAAAAKTDPEKPTPTKPDPAKPEASKKADPSPAPPEKATPAKPEPAKPAAPKKEDPSPAPPEKAQPKPDPAAPKKEDPAAAAQKNDDFEPPPRGLDPEELEDEK
jgi:hypothetical protein